MIKIVRKKSLLRDTVHQTFRWESVADSPRAVWNLSSGNTGFLRFFPDIKNTNFNQHNVERTHLSISDTPNIMNVTYLWW